ncbi:hypothetical protein ABGB12_26875 [Actinocorallia sp. B10E7]|uniref:hypothetical protein n=1 Tax=Actinocorallia sp. B10E7 TaxID=3153558 RepID=UPI00325EC46E
MPNESESRKGPALDRMAGNAANSIAAVGLVQAGFPADVATAIGGIVGPLGEELSYALRTRAVRRSERLQRFFDFAVADENLTAEELLQQITYDDLKLELLARAVNAAVSSTNETRLQALARAFVTGALAADDAAVDQSLLVIDALGQLDVPHFRVLAILLTKAPQHFDKDFEELHYSWSDKQIAEHDPGLATTVTALTARLNSLGMVYDEGHGRYGGGAAVLWTLTPFGKACADELARIGQEP